MAARARVGFDALVGSVRWRLQARAAAAVATAAATHKNGRVSRANPTLLPAAGSVNNGHSQGHPPHGFGVRRRWLSGKSGMVGGVEERYLQLAGDQEIELDPSQLLVAQQFDRLAAELERFQPISIDQLDESVLSGIDAVKRARAAAELAAQEGGGEDDAGMGVEPDPGSARQARARATARASNAEQAVTESCAEAPEGAANFPTGMYVHGSVGCGKTMLLDMFFDCVAVRDGRKQRVHFHSFMRDIFRHLHELTAKSSDTHRENYDHNLLRPLAKAIAKQSYVLCFDEVQIPDIGTAAIMYRLFQYLHEYGVVLVGTSNRAPETLYQGHFNETLFEPWVTMMESRWDVINLESEKDYRRELGTVESAPFSPGNVFSDCYFHPVDRLSRSKMDASWQALTEGQSVEEACVHVFGREVTIPKSTATGMARFTFSELCSAALGPADYLAIARAYHTIFVDNIPELNMQRRNEARRFISLVDALYECNTNIYCDAADEPDSMFVSSVDQELHYDVMLRESLGDMADEMGYSDKVFTNQLFTGEEEVFASKRCISRLLEMRGGMYRTSPHQPGLGFAGLDVECLEFDSLSRDPLGTATEEEGTPLPTSKQPQFTSKHFWGAGWWEKVVGGKEASP